jgi:hypothetical protein
MRSVILLAVLAACQVAPSSEGRIPPKDFTYPPSRTVVVVPDHFVVDSLDGTVVDPTGSAMRDVLVEIVKGDRNTRVDARLTSKEGMFAFVKIRAGKHTLRLSKPGFDTLIVTVLVKKGAKDNLRIQLELST